MGVKTFALILAAGVACAPLAVLAQQGAAKPAAPILPSAQTSGSVQVAPLTVTGAAPPKVGAGAPLYSVQDLQDAGKHAVHWANDARLNAIRCQDQVLPTFDTSGPPTLEHFYRTEYEAALKLDAVADKAAKASEAAAAARQAAAADPGNAEKSRQSQMAELLRQSAVNAFIAARKDVAEAREEIADLMELLHEDETNDPDGRRMREASWRSVIDSRHMERQALGEIEGIIPAPEYFDMKITDVTAAQRSDNKGDFLQVTGKIHNPRAKPVRIPPITLAALDSLGFTLSTLVADSGKQDIPAGQSIAFAYEFRPTPQKTARLFVTFAGEDYRPSMLGPGYFCRAAPMGTIGGGQKGTSPGRF